MATEEGEIQTNTVPDDNINYILDMIPEKRPDDDDDLVGIIRKTLMFIERQTAIDTILSCEEVAEYLNKHMPSIETDFIQQYYTDPRTTREKRACFERIMEAISERESDDHWSDLGVETCLLLAFYLHIANQGDAEGGVSVENPRHIEALYMMWAPSLFEEKPASLRKRIGDHEEFPRKRARTEYMWSYEIDARVSRVEKRVDAIEARTRVHARAVMYGIIGVLVGFCVPIGIGMAMDHHSI